MPACLQRDWLRLSLVACACAWLDFPCRQPVRLPACLPAGLCAATWRASLAPHLACFLQGRAATFDNVSQLMATKEPWCSARAGARGDAGLARPGAERTAVRRTKHMWYVEEEAALVGEVTAQERDAVRCAGRAGRPLALRGAAGPPAAARRLAAPLAVIPCQELHKQRVLACAAPCPDV